MRALFLCVLCDGGAVWFAKECVLRRRRLLLQMLQLLQGVVVGAAARVAPPPPRAFAYDQVDPS
jgi:hypothetical protein